MALTQISTAGVKDDAVTSGKIPANAVGSSELADNAVDTAAIADDAVTDAKLANSINSAIAANTAKTSNATHTGDVTGSTSLTIANSAVTTDKLSASAVSTAKIANSAVTDAKIADNAVITAKLSSSAVSTAKIADQAVTLAKLPHGTSSNDGKFLRANNGADPTFESVSSRVGRNIIVNGAMRVAQHGGSHTNLSTSGVMGSVDRMLMIGANLDELAFTAKQTSDGPDGFSRCWEFDVTTAENALDANDLAYVRYKVEGMDLEPFFNANGTGKDFVISFYVKAYQAGTYQLNIYKNTGPRFISKTYTIAQSGVWQRIEIPFSGDTGTSGININNGIGFQIAWMLIAGTDYTSAGVLSNWGGWPGNTGFAGGHAVNVGSSANNYFRITGIQLELGSVATPFEHKSYPDYLRECERYYVKDSYGGIRNPIHGNPSRVALHVLPQAMRATPSASASQFNEFSAGTARSVTAFYLGGNKGGGYAQLNASPGNGVYVYVTFDAEL